MAVLPDLDTNTVGVIGFWNFLDHSTDSSLDPSEVVSEPSVNVWEQYDNGVLGTITPNSADHRTGHFRVKGDGWFMVYLDRTNEFVTQTDDNTLNKSYLDIVQNWRDRTTDNVNIPETVLTRAIDRLRLELSNSGTSTFNHSDCGIYSYDYPNANYYYQVNERYAGGGGFNGGLSYRSDVTRYYHAIGGCGRSGYYGDSDIVNLGFGGINLVNHDVDNTTRWGAADVLSQNAMPSADTVYSNHGTAEPDANGAIITHFIMAQA